MTTTALAGPPAGTRSGRRERTAGSRSRASFLRRWLSPIALILLWQLASATGTLDERKLAAPTQVWSTAVELVRDGTLGTQTLVSVQRVAIGFAIGAVIGLLLAVVAGLSRVGEGASGPPMPVLRTLPPFGPGPLFHPLFGM